ncbi:hypothetical protein AAG906_008616 [Vitis piasezkii]
MTILKGIILFLLLCFLLSTISTSSHPNTLLCNQIEKHALLSFKHALTDPGNRLSSWSAKEDCCGWNGVRCHNITGRVSPALLQLEILNYLDLSWNDFGGAPISSFLGCMQSLTYLNLCCLGNLSNFHSLHLCGGDSFNQPQLYVENLDMSSVDLHKKVQWLEFTSMLPSLSKLYLDDCKLDNMSPSLGYLEDLSLDYNSFDGPIPSSLGNLSSLIFLSLYGNSSCKMGPKFPTWLQTQTSLWSLDISKSGIKDIAPTWFWKWASHIDQLINLSDNQISGNLSGVLLNNSYIDLSYNCFTGEIPDSLGSLFELNALHLNNNSLSGDIPPSLRNCISLGLLDLGDNKFSGNVPSWMGEWTTLMVLSLRSNRLIGNIPPQICQLSFLTILDFADNSLSGTIPKCFNNFSSMTTIGTEDEAFSVLEYYENLMLVIKGRNQSIRAF